MPVGELEEPEKSADSVEGFARFHLRAVAERAGRNGAGLGPTFENGFVVSHARSVGRADIPVRSNVLTMKALDSSGASGQW